jgi:O-methyltransferase involved in polyketide biosynthesis
MQQQKVDLRGIERKSVPWTMLCTLYLRAYESRAEHSILGDRAAAEAVDRIEYDFERMRRDVRPAGNQYLVALRARQFDAWARDFLDRYPNAVVLHLGCGLDGRAFRLDVPAGQGGRGGGPPQHDWFDVDVPEVMQLRRRLYAEHDRYRMIAASVTDPAGLDEVPEGRPALVIAEGLLMYLREPDVRQLLQRLTDRFPTGELLFDAMPPLGERFSKIAHWGLGDPRELERWNPRLRYLETTSALAQFAKIPVARYRRVYRLCNAIPGVRSFNRLYRFGF